MTLFDEAQAASAPRRVSLVRLASEVARSLAPIGRFSVEGECHQPSRRGGRIWFTLRDRAAQIRVTVPAGKANRARAVNGEHVQVTGRLEWVSGYGQLQLVAEEVLPVGLGAISAMIAEARERLRRDGLLDRERHPVPALPARIGVVCGADAAVRHDISSVVAAHWPGYPVLFHEVTVSGPGAPISIVAAINELDRRSDVEVIVLARGGGDATQLLPFSDEEVCRAVAASTTPIVSAIGHEEDRPLCDEVADMRRGTPSLAAVAVVPRLHELHERLRRADERRAACLAHRLDASYARLGAVDRDRAVLTLAERVTVRLDRAADRLAMTSPRLRIEAASASLADKARQLEALAPARVLERGYAIVRTPSGSVVRDASTLDRGERLDVEVARGGITALVEEVRP